MKVCIFSNCQGGSIVDFFPKTIEVIQYHNFNYIFNTELCKDIKNHLMTCDWFIYQPLSNVYPVYNTDNLKTFLKPGCRTISFPYIFNDAFTPIYKTVKYDMPINGEYSTVEPYSLLYRNIEPITELKRQGFTLEQILELYKNNQLDFKYQERFDNTIEKLQEKEQYTDVKVSQFILDNYKKCSLFNYHPVTTTDTHCNHPSNILLLYCFNQIFHLMGLEPVSYSGPELVGGRTLVSRYDIAFHKYEWIDKESELIDDRIKSLISEVYEKF